VVDKKRSLESRGGGLRMFFVEAESRNPVRWRRQWVIELFYVQRSVFASLVLQCNECMQSPILFGRLKSSV